MLFMKNTLNLIRLGSFLNHKYGGIDASSIKGQVQSAIQSAIQNASSGNLGIMPFMKMLQQDRAALNINVTRDGDNIAVSVPSLDNVELEPKYALLSKQIKTYLEKYTDVFPTVINGERVNYNNLTITLSYAPPLGSEPPLIASN
jgi:hypothetical protein